jgi:hypothetical protein
MKMNKLKLNEELNLLFSQNMLYICLDLIRPEDMDYAMQSLDTASFKGVKLTNVLRSLSKSNESETIRDRIECLEKLSVLCLYGHKYCTRIKLDFRLAHEVVIKLTNFLSFSFSFFLFH